MLNNKLVFYADDVYLDMVPVGFTLPASSDVRIPIDTQRESAFVFGVGQLSDVDWDIDFQELVRVQIDDFPSTPDGIVLVNVHVDVKRDKTMDIDVTFSSQDDPNSIIGEGVEYTDIAVD